jgi:hypothetical protein
MPTRGKAARERVHWERPARAAPPRFGMRSEPLHLFPFQASANRCIRISAGRHGPRVDMGTREWLIGLGLALSAAGCGHGPRHVSDEDPSDKIPAVELAARTRDRGAIPQLIRDLASDDSAVRFYAIDALRRMTQQTFGYRYFDDEEHRAPAIARWKQWYQRLQPPPSTKPR